MQCRAESWFLLTPPGRQSTCYEMLHNPVVSKIQRAMFSAQGNMSSEVTPKSRLALVGRDFRLNCIQKQELRRYDPRSKLPRNNAFSTPFQSVLPPSGRRIRAASGRVHPLSGTPGNVVRSFRLRHAPRSKPPAHHAPRPMTSGPAGSGWAQTLSRWLLPGHRPSYCQRANRA